MEKRIGAAIILVEEKTAVPQLNNIISNHSDIIVGRQGVPMNDRNMSVITLIFEGTTDQIGSLTGQIGRIKGLQVKSATLKSNIQNRTDKKKYIHYEIYTRKIQYCRCFDATIYRRRRNMANNK